MSFVIANNIPFSEMELDPVKSIESLLAFDSRDWGASGSDAWLYGIVFGWPLDVIDDLASQHKWSARQIRRLRLLHLAWRRRVVHESSGSGS